MRKIPSRDKGEAGELRLLINGTHVRAQFDANQDKAEKLVLHVAVLGMNLETRVKDGENKGKTLHHDFVALELMSVPLNTTSDGHEAMIELPGMDAYPEERAIVAWTSANDNQTPIQSVGGLLR